MLFFIIFLFSFGWLGKKSNVQLHLELTSGRTNLSSRFHSGCGLHGALKKLSTLATLTVVGWPVSNFPVITGTLLLVKLIVKIGPLLAYLDSCRFDRGWYNVASVGCGEKMGT